MCGFSHDGYEGRSSGKMAHPDALAEERGWYPSLVYTCKWCRGVFGDVRDVVEHCRSVHSAGPRWRRDNWRAER